MKPTVFIHAKKSQWVSAKITEYSLKRNSKHPDQFETRIIYLEDYPFLYGREGQHYKRERRIIRWSKRDPQSFVLLRFLPPQLMHYEGRALVMDPDIFAVGDIYDLLSRDMGGKAILCRQVYPKWNRPPFYVSSVMLLDCSKLKHWQWEKQIEQMFNFKKYYNRWLAFGDEPEESLGAFEEEWNHYDTLNEKTKLLHNTRRSTQPWMTDLPYDRLPTKDEKKILGFIPEHWAVGVRSFLKGQGYLPYGRYEKHPDPSQEKFFFSLLKECLAHGILTKKDLEREIKKKNIRPDTFEQLDTVTLQQPLKTPMTFVTFHVNSRRYDPKTTNPSRLINLLFRSASFHHPTVQKVLLTDRHTDFSSLDPDIEIRRYDIDAAKTMFSRMHAEIEYLAQHDFSSHILLLDSDMLVNSDLEPLFLEDFDIALTYRKEDGLPYKRRELAINGGVIFLHRNRKKTALEFLERVFAVYQTKFNTPEFGRWWGDQHALVDVIGHSNMPPGGAKTVLIGETKTHLLPCEIYNFSPRSSYLSIWRELKDKKILHFKGRRKKMMPLYWKLYFTKPGMFSILIRTFILANITVEPLVHKLIALKWYKQIVSRVKSLFTKTSQKITGRLCYFKNDLILKKLIKGNKILIIGSGPSAAELDSIPPQVKIFTCNLGLKLLADKRIDQEVDLFFVVKSKLNKTIQIGDITFKKMEMIEDSLKQINVKSIVTNKLDYAHRIKALDIQQTSVLFDDGIKFHYLKSLIKPHHISQIQGRSPVPATSCGLRLLQYALYFGAKEIYLIGIDFGNKGYFWGPNHNEWRHTDIDENFIKVVSQKYDNIYSLSKNSPLTQYVRYKDPQELGRLKD